MSTTRPSGIAKTNRPTFTCSIQISVRRAAWKSMEIPARGSARPQFMKWLTTARKGSASCRSIFQTVSTARPATSWIPIKLLTGSRRKVVEARTIRACESFQAVAKTTLVLVLAVVHGEVDPASHHFFQSNPRVFVFHRIDVDARPRASLQLLASLCGENYQTIFRINFRRLRFFRDLFNHF